ncbi:hypothetical protein ACOBQX_13685 [Actinokineospora sp. G85]|uniref:hypothetical protein n=1 Tax=Actinokineospora sp. G85 TaxID=3406626 RepID=UPI003C72D82E
MGRAWFIALLPLVWPVFFLKHRLDPQTWAGSAACGGVLAGFSGISIALRVFFPGMDAFAAVVMSTVGGPVLVAVLMAAVAAVLAKVVLGDDLDALVETPFPLTFRAEGDRKLKLRVGDVGCGYTRWAWYMGRSHPRGTGSFADVRAVEVVDVPKRRRVDFQGGRAGSIVVRPGAAVRIDFGEPERAWLFRSARAEDVARVVRRRVAGGVEGQRGL